ncbi:hypothetical protein EIP91_010841 [Steccherinum ochraceum]|uniref:Uncharacterized protein n=1 Tax=Steccherinum ochraceum TaxID=92696 RepID=A0A4V2MV32_9APHY|nr:hypothetical protein EIP91_010841 [Steccherinum ochraceum]
MQPVPCWEKVWTLPQNAAPGATLKVYKWVKTDKVQQFSDDEGETDQPLAPLPDVDEPEVVEGDDDMDQDDAPNRDSAIPDTTPVSRAESEMPSLPKVDDDSKPATPKPHPLSVSFQPPSPPPVVDDDVLDESLQPLPTGDDISAGVNVDVDVDVALDLTGMGPDGEPFEGAPDISQLQPDDALLGGALMDEDMADPFVLPQ